MKKKLCLFAIAALMLLSLLGMVACGKSDGKNAEETDLALHRPTILTDIEVGYGVKNEKVELADASASDGVTMLDVAAKMTFNDTEYDIRNGFIPTEVGTYTYTVSATGTNGVTAEKSIEYYIEENVAAFNTKISSFDKPYGVTQAGYTYGRAAYSSETKFGDEQGSLQLQLNPRLSPAAYEFILTNLDRPDITQYDAVYFYVYNASDVNLYLYFHWVKSYPLKPRAWTRISLDRAEYETVVLGSNYESVRDNLTLTDINGLNINISYSNGDMVLRDDAVYLSAIRGLNRLGYKELSGQIEDILTKQSYTELEADNIEYFYSRLSAQAQGLVTNYVDFQELIIKNAMQNAGVTPVPDKLLYFDSAAGLNQISAAFGVKSLRISNEQTYQGDATLEITAGGAWDFGIKIDSPFIYDISDYDVLYLSVYNGSDDDLLLYNSDSNTKNFGYGLDYTLKANSWNRVVVPIGDTVNVVGSTLWVRQADWNHAAGILAGTKFNIAAVYAGSIKTSLDELISSGDYSDEVLAESIVSAYRFLSVARQNEIQDVYNEFMTGYVAYLSQSGKLGENTVIAFDSEMGRRQILDAYSRADISYTTDVKYGEESGSTKFTAKENADLDLFITIPAVTTFSGNETLCMYVYYEGEKDYNLYFNSGNWGTDTSFKLKSGEWTKITIELNGITSINGYMFMVMDKDWVFDRGETVYFSALKIVT